jgi:hypothetical protein
MRIVLIYRPELCDTDGDHKPFEGIEVLGVANDDDGAMELIQRVKDEALAEPNSPTTKWQYHIDSV